MSAAPLPARREGLAEPVVPPSEASTTRLRREQPTEWQRITYRWTAITIVLGLFLLLYTQHPYYRNAQFAPWRPTFAGIFAVWVAFGLFYVRATLRRFTGMRYMVRDSGLHLVLLAKAWRERRLWRVVKNPRVRTTVLAILVKAFFLPLMTGFFAGHLNNIANAWLRHKNLAALRFDIPGSANALVQASTWFQQFTTRLHDMAPHAADFAGLFTPSTWTLANVRFCLDLMYDVVFFVDCGWALMGYSLESRWLGNKTRSVEPTAFGWAVCLACYPPFNNVTGTYLPLDRGAQLVTSDVALTALKAASVALFVIYASATVSFGFKFSNLTHRGVVSRGPYRLLRHPAYVTKCTAWWLEHLPTMTLAKAFFLTLLCGVYTLRAWTEERHLGRDPAYREYKKKVPWILIPGVY